MIISGIVSGTGKPSEFARKAKTCVNAGGGVVVTMRGKEIRLERIMNRNTKKTVIIPMDHGVTNGPIAGLIDMGQAVNLVAEGGANAVIGHMGLALHGHRQGGRDVGLIRTCPRARRWGRTRTTRCWSTR